MMRAAVGLTFLLSVTTLAGCLGGEPLVDPVDPTLVVDDLAATGLARLLPVSSFEPTIAVSRDGAIFMSVFEGIGPAQETVYRSRDHGLSWESVTPTWADTGLANYPGNSNDPFVYLDRDTDRLFNFEMQGLSCNTMAYSDDEGDSWTTVPLGCTPTQVVQDHQSIFTSRPTTLTPVGYDNIVHYCVNRVADTSCAFSLDGGISWGPMVPLVYSGISQDCVVAGGLAAHGTSGPDGTAYLPRGYCGLPTVALSEDDGLTWTTHLISETPMIGHEVRMAIDEAGIAHAAWIGTDRHVMYARSLDGGRTWDEAVDVTPAGVTITDFPAIAAGAEGRVAIAFIGSDTNATNDDGEPVGYNGVPWDANWTAWIVTGTGLEGNETVWRPAATNATGDPIARGVCGGTRCQAGGGLGDFIDIDIDETGRPWAAFVDVCHEECRNATQLPEETCGTLSPVTGCTQRQSVNDHALGMVGTLNTGPSLRGDLVALSPLEVAASLSQPAA